MTDLTLLKLGGSLITDKRVERAFRAERVDALAGALAAARSARPDLQLILGHGSGSFGHMAASRHDTVNGVTSAAGWAGFAEVALVAAELSALVVARFAAAGLPVMRFQPSASTRCHDGRLTQWELIPLEAALDHGLIPVVHGDVAFDDVRGGTITSTEALFFYLAEHLPVKRIVLLGEVEGVLDGDGRLIRTITPGSLADIQAALRGSAGTDVTGGMASKVRDMVQLVQRVPGLEVQIMDGREPERVQRALLALGDEGTLITA
jgi:isopentenyl phosphate kinase